MRKDNKSKEKIGKYGEFVSSFFGWITPEKQKEITKKLENVTKNKKNEK